MEHGAVGAVRRWSVTPGISVARFSAEPTKNAILRASSTRNSCARTGAAAVGKVRLFMFISCALSLQDTSSPSAWSNSPREIGKKSEGSGYRFDRSEEHTSELQSPMYL